MVHFTNKVGSFNRRICKRGLTNMDSGTILILKQELVDKDLPTLSQNSLNSKIMLKEKLVTVSLIPPQQQDIMKKRHYWRLDSKSITMFKVKENVQDK